MEISYKLEEINKACDFVLNNSLNKLILFEGDLGLGKTTLIKNICRVLGSSDNISSPTFPILTRARFISLPRALTRLNKTIASKMASLPA